MSGKFFINWAFVSCCDYIPERRESGREWPPVTGRRQLSSQRLIIPLREVRIRADYRNNGVTQEGRHPWAPEMCMESSYHTSPPAFYAWLWWHKERGCGEDPWGSWKVIYRKPSGNLEEACFLWPYRPCFLSLVSGSWRFESVYRENGTEVCQLSCCCDEMSDKTM